MAAPAQSRRLPLEVFMVPKRPIHRARLAREAHASSSDDALGPAVDAADAPDSLDAGGPIQAVAPAGRDALASDIARTDKHETGSMEAVAQPDGSGGMPGFVEPPAREGEGDASTGDPWN
jgi:hypothetical protein